MAELPEIVAMTSAIATKLELYTIRSVVVNNAAPLYDGSAKNFRSGIVNKMIVRVWSFGKYLVLDLDDESKIVMHFALKGELDVSNKKPHCADVIIGLCNGEYVSFVDHQNLAKIFLVPSEKAIRDAGLPQLALETSQILDNLGPEAVCKAFNEDYLYAKVIHSTMTIKSLLCNQSIVSGIGNTYVDEILFDAKIMPNRKCSTLDRIDCMHIVRSVRVVLGHFIYLARLAAVSDFRLSTIEKSTHKHTKVHCKAICPECKQRISYKLVAGKGTYFCQRCQGGSNENRKSNVI